MDIIRRNIDIKRVKEASNWKLIYGRRKTGKTFLVRNFIKYDEYYLVKRDGRILCEDFSEITYEILKDRIKRDIERKIFVIDEFHRLPEDFFDFLQMFQGKGNLILITSTLARMKELLKGNPTLGMFDHIRIDIIDERDILLELSKEIKNSGELIEACVYLREPILISRYKGNIRRDLSRFFFENRDVIQRLIWEIFSEEERSLTMRYLIVLESIADGKRTSGEISQEMARILNEKISSYYVQRYLKELIQMGIIEKIRIFNKDKFQFFHISPLFDIHFYLEAKYGYLEEKIPRGYIEDIINEKIPLHVEQFFRSLLSKVFGMKPIIISKPDLEIDIALTEFQKLRVVAEVKWKKEIERNELIKIEEKLNKFKDCKKILIVPERDILPYKPKIEVWDVEKTLCVINKKNEEKLRENFLK